MFYALLQSARGWTASVIHGWQVSLSAFFFLNGDCTHHIHTAGDSDMPQWVCVWEREKQMNWIHASCLWLRFTPMKSDEGTLKASTFEQLVCRTWSYRKFPEVPPNSSASAARPDLGSEPPSLCVCHALKPLEGFSSCHKCQHLLSSKMDEPALTGQTTLSKISSSSFSSCLLSLYYALCLLWGRSWENLLGLVAAAPRSGARLLPCFASSLCKWRPLKETRLIDLHCFLWGIKLL